MRVFVLHQDDTPLMPTSPAKARHLLEKGQATVARREPFTIRLKVPSDKHRQPVTIGVDLGAKTVGVAAAAEGSALYQGEVANSTLRQCRQDGASCLAGPISEGTNMGGRIQKHTSVQGTTTLASIAAW